VSTAASGSEPSGDALPVVREFGGQRQARPLRVGIDRAPDAGRQVQLAGVAAGRRGAFEHQALAERIGLPAVAERPADARPDLPVQPAATALTGDLDDDRATVITWADAGTTHLLVRAGPETVAAIARHLAPVVAMPGFPRIVAESPLPLPWPGTA